MISTSLDRAASLALFLGIGLAVSTLPGSAAWGDVGGRGFVVAVSETDGPSLEADIAEAKERGATGVLIPVSRVSAEATERARRVCALAERQELERWIGIAPTWENALKRAGQFGEAQLTGVALLFPAPQGEPPKPGDSAAQLEIKHRGDLLGQTIRQLKAGLPESWKLVVCLAASEIDPETVRDRYLPVKDLIRDGTLDGVCLAGAETMKFPPVATSARRAAPGGYLPERRFARTAAARWACWNGPRWPPSTTRRATASG